MMAPSCKTGLDPNAPAFVPATVKILQSALNPDAEVFVPGVVAPTRKGLNPHEDIFVPRGAMLKEQGQVAKVRLNPSAQEFAPEAL